MKATFAVDKNTPISKIPDVLRYTIIHTVAHEVFSSTIANAVVRDVGQENEEDILADLLRLFFDSKPDGAIAVEVDVRATTHALESRLMEGALRSTQRVVQIPSQSDIGVVYEVTLKDGHAISCECASFLKGHRFCKHMSIAERIV